MTPIPRDPSPESSLSLLDEGYLFMANRRRQLDAETFATRLMLREAICIVGEEAARFFYADDRFTRQGAMPPTTVRLLQDKGSVNQIDGDARHQRKAMFMSLMTLESLQRLTEAMDEAWQARLPAWERQEEVVLREAVQEILCRAACAWVGIPVSERSASRRTEELAAMVEGAGSVGPRMVHGMVLRARNERWARRVISQIRAGNPAIAEGSPAHVIAWHRDLDGALLDTSVAAVEMINLLRPTVAVDRFITFAAHALHEHPECREAIVSGGDTALEYFVQEVRRYYPFFPFMGGIARSEVEWNGHHYPEGTWFILDGYGTNHDPRIWGDPEVFRPERFRHWDGSAYSFIPQGGGGFESGHRCPGEWATIALMKAATRQLTTAMTYDVPLQDLTIDLARMPTVPRSGFVIRNVREARTSCD